MKESCHEMAKDVGQTAKEKVSVYVQRGQRCFRDQMSTSFPVYLLFGERLY